MFLWKNPNILGGGMKDNKTWEGVHMFENTLPETIQEQEYKEYKCTFP